MLLNLAPVGHLGLERAGRVHAEQRHRRLGRRRGRGQRRVAAGIDVKDVIQIDLFLY